MEQNIDLSALEQNIGYKFKNINLLKNALVHTSYAYEKNISSNEKLEFLGDSILEFISSKYIYSKYPNLKEGEMTKIRANYVCEKALACYSRDIGIDKCIRLGHGQIHNLNDTIIADVFEAVAAVIYLDQGYDVVKKYLDDIIIPYIKEKRDFNTDYKTMLQEAVQTTRRSLEYVLLDEYGEAHDKTFEMAVKIDNIVYGKGIGKSKKEAEQNAALDALKKSAVK